MMTREEILTACSTEPEKIVQLIQSIFQRNQELEARIQVLEAQGKKTVQIAICLLLPIGHLFRNLHGPHLFEQKQRDY
jgi:hypothetical protein